jgi:hypothetical protein
MPSAKRDDRCTMEGRPYVGLTIAAFTLNISREAARTLVFKRLLLGRRARGRWYVDERDLERVQREGVPEPWAKVPQPPERLAQLAAARARPERLERLRAVNSRRQRTPKGLAQLAAAREKWARMRKGAAPEAE